jgi:signal transduction histidine kinase/predicted hydrocarbon binding protein
MPRIDSDLLCGDEDRPGVLHSGAARVAMVDLEGFWALRAQVEALVGHRSTGAALQQAGIRGGASLARAWRAHGLASEPAEHALLDSVAAFQALGFGRFEVETLDLPGGRVIIRGVDTFEARMAGRHRRAVAEPACFYTAGVFLGFMRALVGRDDVVAIERVCQALGHEACLFELLPAEQVADGPAAVAGAGPFLSQQLGLLEILLDCLPIGVAVFDRELRFRRCNQTWMETVVRHGPSAADQVLPGVSWFDLAPGTEEQLMPIIERVLAGGTARQDAFRLESGGGVSYWDVVWSPLIEDGDVAGIVHVITNATDRVLAYQDLEQRVADRARELAALTDVMAAAGGSLELETVLQRSLAKVLEVMDSQVGAIHLLDETGVVLILAASQGVDGEVLDGIGRVSVGSGLAGWTIEQGQPLVVPRVADGLRPLLAVPAGADQVYVGVPIRARGRVQGVLSIIGAAGREFSQREVALLASVADQVGTAVENAQLYRKAEQLAVVRERERLARELHDSITQSLYSMTLLAEAGQRLARAGDLERVEGYLARLADVGQQALREMRLLVYELRPLVLKREGLIGALQQRLDAVERRAGVEARLLIEGRVELPAAVEEGLYRIAQEALNNALKHAAPTSVTVSVCTEGDQVTLEVMDNGCGFDAQTRLDVGGMGLIGMRERADRLGGELTIRSRPGEGTTVTVSVPMPPWSKDEALGEASR